MEAVSVDQRETHVRVQTPRNLANRPQGDVGFDNTKQIWVLMPLVFVAIQTMERGPGVCHPLEGQIADVV